MKLTHEQVAGILSDPDKVVQATPPPEWRAIFADLGWDPPIYNLVDAYRAGEGYDSARDDAKFDDLVAVLKAEQGLAQSELDALRRKHGDLD
jgi:hypothetical protein